jgi:hypothetical protein
MVGRDPATTVSCTSGMSAHDTGSATQAGVI